MSKNPRGGVLENFLWRAETYGNGNSCIKTIANPRRIFRYEHAHYPIYLCGGYSVDEAGHRVKGWSNACSEPCEIRINHYFTKSKEEWIHRRKMGKADTKNKKNVRKMEEFYQHDNNDIYDDTMLYYVEKMKQR